MSSHGFHKAIVGGRDMAFPMAMGALVGNVSGLRVGVLRAFVTVG